MQKYFGFIGGFITVSAFVPQVIRTLRTRHTRDLSLGMVGLLTLSGVVWLVYGVLINDWPVILTNIGMVVLNCTLAGAKLRYG
ncbi:MAG TPA: SemiSWEET transporter [Gemmatimonadaceae bacterium]|jgi:MtN3 and saliva related transmembrane protein|nr:SemiSWEET transporter [Gemmatimonadaceae bacterium]